FRAQNGPVGDGGFNRSGHGHAFARCAVRKLSRSEIPVLSLAQKAGACRPLGTEDGERISCLSASAGMEARDQTHETGRRVDSRQRRRPSSGGSKKMTRGNVLCENQQLPVRSFADDLRRALASPGRALKALCRWTLLAHQADLPCAELMRYRRELLADRQFQNHRARGLPHVHYILSQAAELYALVRAAKPRLVVETGVASGLSSAHILRALDRNGIGTLHSIDLPNVQAGSILPEGRTSGWIVPESLRARWKLQLGD